MTRRQFLALLVLAFVLAIAWTLAAPLPAATSLGGTGSALVGAGPAFRARASWYCWPGGAGAPRSRCTRGHPWTELAGAAGPGLPFRLGERVRICRAIRPSNGQQIACVVVRLVDRCPTCGQGIDLYASAFRRLAPLSVGRITVTVGRAP